MVLLVTVEVEEPEVAVNVFPPLCLRLNMMNVKVFLVKQGFSTLRTNISLPFGKRMVAGH